MPVIFVLEGLPKTGVADCEQQPQRHFVALLSLMKARTGLACNTWHNEKFEACRNILAAGGVWIRLNRFRPGHPDERLLPNVKETEKNNCQ